MSHPHTQTTAFRVLFGTSLGLVAVLATVPIALPLPTAGFDRIEHGVAFLVLALLGDFAFPSTRYGLHKALPLFGYGVLIELVQYFLPYRFFEIADIVWDAGGLMSYWVILPVLGRAPWFGARFKGL